MNDNFSNNFKYLSWLKPLWKHVYGRLKDIHWHHLPDSKARSDLGSSEPCVGRWLTRNLRWELINRIKICLDLKISAFLPIWNWWKLKWSNLAPKGTPAMRYYLALILHSYVNYLYSLCVGWVLYWDTTGGVSAIWLYDGIIGWWLTELIFSVPRANWWHYRTVHTK